MRSELPWVSSVKCLTPNGVIADPQRFGNNTFSVEKDTGQPKPRVARFAPPTLGYTQ